MRRRLIPLWLFLFFCSLTYQSYSQPAIKRFVEENTVSITSIDPSSGQFDDLEPLGRAIGKASVVLLGEQDHGDALTFLAKTRIIKYLHEKLGFNVLAFESDFFSLTDGWDHLEKPDSLVDFLRKNIQHVWANCDACNDLLYNYIPYTSTTSSPLQVTGFDNQLFLQCSQQHLSKAIDSLIHFFRLPIGKLPNYTNEIRPLFDSLLFKNWYKVYGKLYRTVRPSEKEFEKCGLYLRRLRSELAGMLDKDSFWLLTIDNLINWNEMLSKFKIPRIVDNIRDAQMAINLNWLLDKKYLHEKIIVWAANKHIAKYKGHGYTSMGYWLEKRSAMHELYSIGFTSYSGTSARMYNPIYKIKAPTSNSLESWIDPKFQFAFLDYLPFNRQNPSIHERFYQRFWVYRGFKDEWNKVFDGIFFIREMRPCKGGS